MIEIKLLDTKLDAQYCISFAQSGKAGGINVFIGTVRDSTQGRKVLRLEYEAYEPMAIAEMEKIARQAQEQYGAENIVVHHRTGILEIGEAAVIIAVSTPHRQASFGACQFIIDTLKQTVPIWKKEIFEDGEIWVAAHP